MGDSYENNINNRRNNLFYLGLCYCIGGQVTT